MAVVVVLEAESGVKDFRGEGYWVDRLSIFGRNGNRTERGVNISCDDLALDVEKFGDIFDLIEGVEESCEG